MRLLSALCFATATMFAATAHPQEMRAAPAAQDEQRELARRFVSVGGSEAQFVQAAIRGFETSLPRHGVNLTDAQRTRLRPTLQVAFQEPARIYVDEMTAFFARTASAADLEAAVTYYESDAGRAYAGAVVDLVIAIALFSASGGATSLPEVPEESAFAATQVAAARRLAAAFLDRMSELEVEQLAASGIEAGGFTNWLARFVASRLSTADVEAAARWAESPESRRLEGPSAERAAAEQLASLRATRAIDLDAIRAELDAIRRENPT